MMVSTVDIIREDGRESWVDKEVWKGVVVDYFKELSRH
jgi:hypothetical protein